MYRLFNQEDFEIDKFNNLITAIKKWPIKLDEATLGYSASKYMNTLIEQLAASPNDLSLLQKVNTFFSYVGEIPLKIDNWKAQNIYFKICKQNYKNLKAGSKEGDELSKKLLMLYDELGNHLGLEPIL